MAQRKAPGASADDSTLRGSEKGREEARGSLYVCAPVLVTYNEGAARRSSSRLIVHSIRQSTVSLPQRSSASMGHDRSTILFKDEVRLRSAHRTQQRTGGQSFDPVGVVFEGRVLYFYRIPSKACASPQQCSQKLSNALRCCSSNCCPGRRATAASSRRQRL